MTEHTEPCGTIKSVEVKVDELTAKIKSMSTTSRWAIGLLVPIFGFILAFLIDANAKVTDKVDKHTVDMVAHRTSREIEEMQKNETMRFEYLKKELYELRRGQSYLKGRQR